jgi:hypothetical protein
MKKNPQLVRASIDARGLYFFVDRGKASVSENSENHQSVRLN